MRPLSFLSLLAALFLAPAVLAVPVTPLSPKRIDEIAAFLPEKPAGFGQPYHGRAAWEALAAHPAAAKMIPLAAKLITKPFPAWSDNDYLDYSKTGRRVLGETMMRNRISWLAPLVLAECIENKGRFVPALETILDAYAKQPTWTLPAHDGALTAFTGKKYFVELWSASFAHDLALALYLLDDKIRPAIRQEVIEALDARIFQPVKETLLTGTGNHGWLVGKSNWNAVCLAGVTGAALTILPDRHERAFFTAAAEIYSRNFVAGYYDDGYCAEGVGYYNYGFGNFVLLREKLFQSSGGRLDLFSDPKIRRMALFGPNCEIINDTWPAFADCRIGTKVSPQILWYSSRVLSLGLRAYEKLDPVVPGDLAPVCLYAFPNSASQTQVAGQTAVPVGLRSYFDKGGVLICRPAPGSACRVGVALNGGNNGDSHNHNDLGSYALIVGREQLLGDPGGPNVYTAKTFSHERYTGFKLFASYGHPVPLVGGIQQREGRDAEARITKAGFTPDADVFAMDISSAYDKLPGAKVVRTFKFSRSDLGELEIRDDFDFLQPEPVEVALTTRSEWRQTGPDLLEFSQGGERLTATIHAPQGGFELGSEVIEENCSPFTRIAIKLKQPATRATLVVTFRPASPERK